MNTNDISRHLDKLSQIYQDLEECPKNIYNNNLWVYWHKIHKNITNFKPPFSVRFIEPGNIAIKRLEKLKQKYTEKQFITSFKTVKKNLLAITYRYTWDMIKGINETLREEYLGH